MMVVKYSSRKNPVGYKLKEFALTRVGWKIVFALPVLAFLIVPAGAVHTYHVSLTRIDHNQQDKLLEITLQLFTHDLQPVLEKRTKRRLDLGKTPEIDKLIFEYLNEHFVLQDKNGEARKPVWVGKEFEHDAVYVHLEIPFDDTLDGAQLQNTIFFESFAEQTNLVVARWAGKKTDLVFTAGDKFKSF